MHDSIPLNFDAREQVIAIECVVDDARTFGRARRRDFSRSERIARAGRTALILAVIGTFSIVVPLLHFVLPPLFWLGAVVLGATTFAETAEVLGGEAECPNCHRLVKLSREAEEWPRRERCPGCSFTLTFRPR